MRSAGLAVKGPSGAPLVMNYVLLIHSLLHLHRWEITHLSSAGGGGLPSREKRARMECFIRIVSLYPGESRRELQIGISVSRRAI